MQFRGAGNTNRGAGKEYREGKAAHKRCIIKPATMSDKSLLSEVNTGLRITLPKRQGAETFIHESLRAVG